MNIVYISPHFPSQYHRFCLELKRAGASALGIGDAPYDALPESVRQSLTEYYHLPVMEQGDGLVREIGRASCRERV